MPLSAKLIEAYRNAEYVVFADPNLIFRIGEPSAELDALLDDAEATTAAFVTDANRHGKRDSDEENAGAAERLHIAGLLAGFDCLRGEGRDPMRRWAAEPSSLIIGVSREQARAFGEEFEQNAIVFCEKGKPPELEFLV